MENLPVYISILFAATACLTVFLFYKAAHRSGLVLMVVFVWLLVQSLVSLSGFYLTTNGFPPRFILLIAPPVVFIAVMFFTAWGKKFIDSLDIKFLTLLHVIRIPVEIVLFLLFAQKAVPAIMTFEGSNFDIISGLTAPVFFYFGFIKKIISNKILLLWNIICLGLLINIVVIAILSAPFSFQKLAFDQPNIALLYFPFIWLPCCIVALVLFSHLVAIRQLVMKMKRSSGKEVVFEREGEIV